VNDPLDAALHRLDAQARAEATDRDRRAQEAKAQREQLVALIAGFLRRMNNANPPNPGCTFAMKVGRFRTENVWNLGFQYSDDKGGIIIAPDGRVNCERRDKRGYVSFSMIPYTEVDEDWLYRQYRNFAHLSRRMAEELRKHGVA
jgi:hypothetical protein